MQFTELAQLDPNQDYDGIALYSGGTDSTLAPLLAREQVGDKILLVMVDLGETESARAQAIERAEVIGWDLLITDQRRAFADNVLSEAIQMRASYWGYPLGTPLGRAFQLNFATQVVDLLNSHRRRLRYVIHGCAPRQNTRFRIERFLDHMPDVRPLGPLVTQMLTRQEKVAKLGEYGINAVLGDSVATDQNIYCRALEGDLLNTMDDPSSLPVYTNVASMADAHGQHQIILTFEHGTPTRLNNDQTSLSEIVEECGKHGGRMGVGRICVFEDTIPELGYKERGIYEAPAAVLLATAHRYIEGATLSKLERVMFRELRQQWAEVVYRGNWYTTERYELGAEGARFNKAISGSVTLKLGPGTVSIGDAQCSESLLVSAEATRGAY